MNKLRCITLLLLFTAACAAPPEYLWTRIIQDSHIQYVADAEIAPDECWLLAPAP